MSWQESKPILGRLPYEGYQDNEVAGWLARYWDDLLVATKGRVDDLYRQVNPETCDVEWLDFLAVLAGFTGEYWDAQWSEGQKRTLIAQAFTRIWPLKGTQGLLEWLIFTVFGLQGYVYLRGAFFADLNGADDYVGGGALEFFVCLRWDSGYLREGNEFRLAERITRLYSPAVIDHQVCYDDFYAEFSVAGDPCLT